MDIFRLINKTEDTTAEEEIEHKDHNLWPPLRIVDKKIGWAANEPLSQPI